MSGRIRSVKPEWLEDERIVMASDAARVLSIALLLLADDYGNGRAGKVFLAGRVFPGRPQEVLDDALQELQSIRFVELYERDSQRYFHIRNWAKHQKVDKPGKPMVPGPRDDEPEQDNDQSRSDFVYFARDSKRGHVKIGRSRDPEDRVRKSSHLELLGAIEGGWREREVLKRFSHLRLKNDSEWFQCDDDLLEFIREHSRTFVDESSTIRASRGSRSRSSPDPDPDPEEPDQPVRLGAPAKPQAVGSPTNLSEALVLPVIERARALQDRPDLAQWLQPHCWPEVISVAKTLHSAGGMPPPRLGSYHRDAGVRALVGLFADGYNQTELEAVARRLPREKLWEDRHRRGLASMTPEVVRRSLAETSEGAPDPEAAARGRARLERMERANAEHRRKLAERAEGLVVAGDVRELTRGIG